MGQSKFYPGQPGPGWPGCGYATGSRTFSLAKPIVEPHEETSARLPKLVRASAAHRHPIRLCVTSQIERDITSSINLMYSTWPTVGVLRTIGKLS